MDGEPVGIEYFTEVQDGKAMETSAPTVASTELKALPTIPRGEPVGTSYLLFIDDLFSIASDRNKVLRGLADEVSYLGPKDLMAIVRWDGNRVEMLSTWSRDWAKLQTVLKEAMNADTFGLHELSRRRSLNDSRFYNRKFGQQTGFNQRNLEEEHYIDTTISKVDRTVHAAAATLRGFCFSPRSQDYVNSLGWMAFRSRGGRFRRFQ